MNEMRSIAGRILALPVPAVAAHIGNILFGLPAKYLPCLGGICIYRGEITGTARTDNIRDVHMVDIRKRMYHFQNTDAVAGAKVENLTARMPTARP